MNLRPAPAAAQDDANWGGRRPRREARHTGAHASMVLFARWAQTQRSAELHSHNNAARPPLHRRTVSATLHSHANTGSIFASIYPLLPELIFFGGIARNYGQKGLLNYAHTCELSGMSIVAGTARRVWSSLTCCESIAATPSRRAGWKVRSSST